MLNFYHNAKAGTCLLLAFELKGRGLLMEVRKIAVLFRGDPKGITNPQMILPQHLEMVRTAAPQAEIFFAETEEDLLSKTDDADVLLTWGL